MRKARTSASRRISWNCSIRKITKHHGRIVKTTGDGVLAEFASVSFRKGTARRAT
jgi:class 3 adenylate cyclase